MSQKSSYNLRTGFISDIRNSVYSALHVDEEWEYEWFIQFRRNLEDKIFNSLFAFFYEL
jgi:hypothetical protein